MNEIAGELEKAGDSEEKLQVVEDFSSWKFRLLIVSIAIFVSTLALPVSASLLKSTFVQVLERLLHLDVHVSDLLLSPVGKVFFTQMYNFLIYRQE